MGKQYSSNPLRIILRHYTPSSSNKGMDFALSKSAQPTLRPTNKSKCSSGNSKEMLSLISHDTSKRLSKSLRLKDILNRYKTINLENYRQLLWRSIET